MPKRDTGSDDTVARMTALIDAYLRHLEAGGLATTTIRDRGELLHRIDDALVMGLAMATTEEIADWLATPGWSRETKKNYYGHITGFFRWATAGTDPRIDYDPSAGLMRPSVPRGTPKPATAAQLRQALEQLPEPWNTYVALAAYGGARCVEIAALDRSDVTERTLRLRGKGSKIRTVKTHAEVWRRIEPLPAGPVARRIYRGGPVTADYISVGVRGALERIGVHTSAHAFRHWFATTALKPKQFGGGGATVRTVQELLGHASLATTAGYLLVDDEERADAVDALPTFSPLSW